MLRILAHLEYRQVTSKFKAHSNKLAILIAIILMVSSAHADGDVKNLKEYEYRANGQPWKCTVYDPATGKMKGIIYYDGEGTLNKVERFDPDGRKIEAAFYDGKRRLTIGPDSWAAMRWYYQDGVLRLRVSYDTLGKPIERLFYTETGKLIGRMYRDDEDVNPYVNAAMYRLLGGNNVAYYDPKIATDSLSQLADE
jgi:hypothetical protein